MLIVNWDHFSKSYFLTKFTPFSEQSARFKWQYLYWKPFEFYLGNDSFSATKASVFPVFFITTSSTHDEVFDKKISLFTDFLCIQTAVHAFSGPFASCFLWSRVFDVPKENNEFVSTSFRHTMNYGVVVSRVTDKLNTSCWIEKQGYKSGLPLHWLGWLFRPTDSVEGTDIVGDALS